MKYIITPDEMRRLEQAEINSGYSTGLLLMEHAALAVCEKMRQAGCRSALFACGPGNNGADGMAAARIFARRGGASLVWLLGDEYNGDAKIQLNMLRGMNGVEFVTEFTPADVCIDAIFGIGLSRNPQGKYAEAISALNSSGIPIISVDIPSGVNAADGDAYEYAVRARHTITFHRMKPGCMLFPGRELCGEITVAEIGLRDASAGRLMYLERGDIAREFPLRDMNTHKGTYGRVGIVAGSPGMAGAAALAARAALRGGAGLVTVFTHPQCIPVVQTLEPCATAASYTDGGMHEKLQGCDSIVIGPGLSVNQDTINLVQQVLQTKRPTVVDADALNILSQKQEYINALGENIILTPHLGEMSRLTGVPISEIARDAMSAAQQLSQRSGAVVLLKGATSIITRGGSAFLNISGCAAMATGGSGDVLAGLAGALLAQKCRTPFMAAALAAFVHGLAGEHAAALLGETAVTASDIANGISAAISGMSQLRI